MKLTRRAFLLPIALAIIMILVGLGVMLMMQGQQLHLLAVGEHVRLLDLGYAQDVDTLVGAQLNAYPNASPSAVSLGPAKVGWGKGNSVYQPPVRGYGTFKNVLPGNTTSAYGAGEPVPGSSPIRPSAGYLPDPNGTARVPLSPDHTFVAVDLGTLRHDVVYSDLFPYAAYAPQGRIDVANQIIGYLNPPYPTGSPKEEEHRKHSPYPPSEQLSARPVRIRARNGIAVGSFPYGTAESRDGPIEVRSGSARGFTGYLDYPGTYTTMLENQLNRAMATLSTGLLDKTNLIVGSWTNFAGWYAKENDPTALSFGSIFSMQQGYNFPFPFIPTIQGVAGLYSVIAIHSPLQSDFNGVPVDQDQLTQSSANAKRIKEIIAEEAPLIAQRQEYSVMIPRLEEQVRSEHPKEGDPPSVTARQLEAAKKDLEDVEGKLEKLHTEKEALAKRNQEMLTRSDIVAKEYDWYSAKWGVPPSDVNEEETFGTTGWPILRLFTQVKNSLYTLFTDPKTLLTKLIPPLRMYHFAGGAPDIWWPGDTTTQSDLTFRKRPSDIPLDYTSWACTWSMPAGRAVKLHGNYEFRGDLWLRRGSLLVIDGNLRVTGPDEWSDFGYRKTASTSLEKPSGKIVLEEGAVLIVKGDLTVHGSKEVTEDVAGSIVSVSTYGAPPMINSAILVDGNLKTQYGVHSGVLLQDVVGTLKAIANIPSLDGIYNGLVKVQEQTAFHLSKLPWLGPFQWRKCWFSSNAATFLFFPELTEFFPLCGPWPLPIPWKNCLIKPFEYISYAYSAELAMMLGEYHFTEASLLWPWGKGQIPVLNKVEPRELAHFFRNVPAFPSSGEWARNVFKAFLQEVPGLIKILVVKGIKSGLVDLLIQALNPMKVSSPCAGIVDEDAGKEWKDKLKEILVDVLKESVKEAFILSIAEVAKAVHEILGDMRKELKEASDDSNAQLPVQEVSGALIYARGQLTIGEKSGAEGPKMAVGMFVSQGNLEVKSPAITVGTAISTRGSIKLHTLYDFPYFSRASLYRPYLFEDVLKEAWHLELPEGTEAPLEVGRPLFHVTARGWERDL